MRGLSEFEVVLGWELARDLAPFERALELLALAGGRADELEELTIGERDERLLELREQTFGSSMRALASCPRCGEELELELAVDELRAIDTGGTATVGVGERVVELQPATTQDLRAASTEPSTASAARVLAERCAGVAPGVLSEAEVDDVGRRVAELDPRSEILLDLTCPECGQGLQESLDVAEFLWRELEAHAQSLFGEVSTLARAYGWSESEILAMAPARRRAYAELAW